MKALAFAHQQRAPLTDLRGLSHDFGQAATGIGARVSRAAFEHNSIGEITDTLLRSSCHGPIRRPIRGHYDNESDAMRLQRHSHNSIAHCAPAASFFSLRTTVRPRALT